MVPLDGPEFDRWRQQASRTLDTVQLAATGDRPEWACFLAEQGAKLAVKGLLHGIGEEAWGHDLTVLVEAAAATIGSGWLVVDDQAARLSRHYVTARYPDAHPSGPPGAHYRPADAEQAMVDCAAILDAVDRAWAELEGAG